MFTQAQIEKYREGIEFYTNEGEEVVPPRTFNVNDYPEFPVSDPAFGNGHILVLGYVNSEMAECECEHDHIVYAGIREDGMIGPMVTSNTFGEVALNHPDIEPMALMFGMIDPDELGAGVAPDWDDMAEVTPDQWPEVDVPVTDMSEFEF